MGKIEEIYLHFCENKSEYENKQDWDIFNKMQKETKIVMEDNVFFPFVEYLDEIEKRSFLEGFKYAVQLMKECKI